ncbi:Hypothetical predicted protein, partial [Olea europaea subsp. europaea]
ERICPARHVLYVAAHRGEEKNPMGSGSSISMGLTRPSLKVEPPSSLEKKGKVKGKEKVEPFRGGEKKMMLVLTKNIGSPSSPKRQTMINKLLKKPIEVKPISALKIV